MSKLHYVAWLADHQDDARCRKGDVVVDFCANSQGDHARPVEPKSAQKSGKCASNPPPQSGECDVAATKVLPIAKEVDRRAERKMLVPTLGVAILTTKYGGEGWPCHFAVNVSAHFVDALTGSPGTEENDYLVRHFQYHQHLEWRDPDVDPLL